jgi:outer membrane protein assembly factor BamD
MLNGYKRNTILIVFIILLIGCSSKDASKEYNKSASYWYEKIIENSNSDLDKADNYYISLRSEHPHSPLLPTATLILANAHIEDKTYLMADYYLDEYLRKYATGKVVEYAKFLKLKASFLGLKDINRDQELILNTLKNTEEFIKKYPNSIYRPLADTIKVRLKMAEYLLNKDIAELYDRIGKKKASKIYREKNRNSALNLTDIKPPEEGFFDKIFN